MSVVLGWVPLNWNYIGTTLVLMATMHLQEYCMIRDMAYYLYFTSPLYIGNSQLLSVERYTPTRYCDSGKHNNIIMYAGELFDAYFCCQGFISKIMTLHNR